MRAMLNFVQLLYKNLFTKKAFQTIIYFNTFSSALNKNLSVKKAFQTTKYILKKPILIE